MTETTRYSFAGYRKLSNADIAACIEACNLGIRILAESFAARALADERDKLIQIRFERDLIALIESSSVNGNVMRDAAIEGLSKSALAWEKEIAERLRSGLADLGDLRPY